MPGEAPLRWITLDAVDWDRAAAAFTLCYEGYVVPVAMTARDMRDRFASEDVDRSASHLVLAGGEVAALGAVARRGRHSRLAAFGVAPAWRGKGVARPVLERVVAEAAARGDLAMELEVFVHNLPAVRLYERLGFSTTDRLLGFERSASLQPAEAARVDAIEALRLTARIDGDATLPWQLQWRTVSRQQPPWQFVGDPGGSFALVDLSRETAVQMRYVYTPPEHRLQGRARRLVAAIVAQAGGRPVRVAQLVPASLEGLLRRLGFTVVEHEQQRMTKTF